MDDDPNIAGVVPTNERRLQSCRASRAKAKIVKESQAPTEGDAAPRGRTRKFNELRVGDPDDEEHVRNAARTAARTAGCERQRRWRQSDPVHSLGVDRANDRRRSAGAQLEGTQIASEVAALVADRRRSDVASFRQGDLATAAFFPDADHHGVLDDPWDGDDEDVGHAAAPRARRQRRPAAPSSTPASQAIPGAQIRLIS